MDGILTVRVTTLVNKIYISQSQQHSGILGSWVEWNVSSLLRCNIFLAAAPPVVEVKKRGLIQFFCPEWSRSWTIAGLKQILKCHFTTGLSTGVAQGWNIHWLGHWREINRFVFIKLRDLLSTVYSVCPQFHIRADTKNVFYQYGQL